MGKLHSYRNQVLSVFLGALFVASTACGDAPAPVAPVGGDGSEATPWELSEVGHLVWLKDQCNNGGSKSKGVYYKLMNDLDLSDTQTTWTYVPIGKTGDGNQFYGSFDGNGKVISNLYVKTSANIMGLFGVVGAQDGSTSDVCRIRDLSIENASVEGGDYVGGLTARSYYSVIEGCDFTGKVISNRSSGYVGGLVGYSNGDSVLDCNTSVSVTSSGDNAGGLIGCSSGSYVANCDSISIVTGGANCGGLIGYNAPGTVEYSNAESVVSGGDNIGGLIGYNLDDASHYLMGCASDSAVMGTSYVGGLCGYNGCEVFDSAAYADVIGFSEKSGGFVGGNSGLMHHNQCFGDVLGMDYVGGFVGSNSVAGDIRLSFAEVATSGTFVLGGFAGENIGNLNQCYARGDVSGQSGSAGGFVGSNSGIIDEVYGAGLVEGQISGASVGSNSRNIDEVHVAGLVQGQVAGGLAGVDTGLIVKGYWDSETTHQDVSAGDDVSSKTTSEMMQRLTFVDWDFLRVWVNDENTTYPYFAWMTDKGMGCLEGVIQTDEATSAGARWIIGGFAGDYASGEIVGAIASTTYTIEFAPIDGWDTPEAESVYLSDDTTVTVIGRYVKHGGIRVLFVGAPAGAAWSIDGGTTWNASGTTWHGLSVGEYTITYRDVEDYDTPQNATVNVYEDQVTEIVCSNEYVRQTGGLVVTIPDAPAGAGWSIDGGTTWHDSGTTVTDLPTGGYTITFKPIEGYDTPNPIQAAVVDDEVTDVEGGEYVRQMGSLRVTIPTPPEGAAWSIDGGVTWNASQTLMSSVPTGKYTVTLRSVTGYDTPGNMSVVIANGQLTEVESGTYVRQMGSLKVTMTTAPEGAAWSIDGGVTWYGNGMTVGNLPTGNYTVTFKSVDGYLAPSNQNAFVEKNKTTEIVIGGYVRLEGNVTVTIPNAPEGAGWSIDGGATWHQSGETVSTLPVGDYTVIFKPVVDYKGPDNQNAKVNAGETTKITSGAYEFVFDIELITANYTAGVKSSVMPGNFIDMTWQAKSTRAFDKPFWLEIFSSKTGGFDLIQQGTAITGSHYVKNGMPMTATFTPDDLYLHPITDGMYTLVASINRGTLGTAVPECDYVNNWIMVPNKRMTVRNPYSPSLDLSFKSVNFEIDPNDPTRVTVRGIVKNSGPSALEKPFAWVEVFYGTLTAEAQLMKQGSIGNGQKLERLAAGAEAEFVLTGRVPAGVKNRALAVIIDSTDIVPELDETNNVQWSYDPALLPPGKKTGVDLAITAIGVDSTQFAPAVVTAGDSLVWGVTIQNKGTVMPEGWLYLELFASQDGGVSNMRGRTFTWSEQLTPPALGTSKTYILEKPINNIGNGMYSLTAIVNRTGLADNPGDETPLDNIMTEKKGRVSLMVSSTESKKNIVWSEGPSFTQKGDQVTVVGKIRNSGSVATDAFWTEGFVGTVQGKTGIFYRDITTVFARGVYCSGLAAGAEQSITMTGSVKPGQVVGVLADSTDSVPETDETDNYDYSGLSE